MSDNDLSDDGMQELEEIIAEYKTKSSESQEKPNNDSDGKSKKSDSMNLKLCVEVPMDKVLFGDKKGLIKNLSKSVRKKLASYEYETEIAVDCEINETEKQKTNKRKPAWTDTDDIDIKVGEVKRQTKYSGPIDHLNKNAAYKEFLEKKFKRTIAQPKWASLDKKLEENSDDEELLRTVGFINKPKSSTLQPTYIQWKPLKDLNRSTYAEGRITSIQFHPTSTAALVAGVTGIATIYSIDGRENEKLHSIEFKKFPILCSKITPCGTKAIFGSTHHFYFSYDLITGQETKYKLRRDMGNFKNFIISPCGKYIGVAGKAGVLRLFDAVTHELIHSFKQENQVTTLAFTADSSRVICSSTYNNVSIFSLRKLQLEHTFLDEGCIKGQALALSPNQRLLATGSREGAVNVYDFQKVMLTRSPLPEKTFLNLKTSISDVKFNHTSELLAMSSHMVPNAVKLAHFPSCKVYANFPQEKNTFGNIGTLEFSPNSAYLAMGNQKKQVSLIRLKYFKNY